MGHRHIAWARGQAVEGDPKTKFVLMTLATYSDDEGSCWPSQQQLSTDTGMSRSTVQRRLRKLIDLGLIKTRFRGSSEGGRASNMYVLCMDLARHIADAQPPAHPGDAQPEVTHQLVSHKTEELSVKTRGVKRQNEGGLCVTQVMQEQPRNNQEQPIPPAEPAPIEYGRAAKLISEWLGRQRARPDRKLIGDVRAVVQQLLDDDYQPELIKTALIQFDKGNYWGATPLARIARNLANSAERPLTDEERRRRNLYGWMTGEV